MDAEAKKKDRPTQTSPRRPSLGMTKSLRNSFRLMGGSFRGSKGKLTEGESGTASPLNLNTEPKSSDSDVSTPVPHYNEDNSGLRTDLLMSPIFLDPVKRDLSPPPPPEPSTIVDLLSRVRSDSQKRRDSGGSGSKSRPQSSSRISRLRQVVQVDEAEKLNLLAKLRATLHAIEQTLHLTEKDLESHLEENDFVLDKATSDLLERTGLRQIEPNRTLKKIDMKDDNPGVFNAWSACDPSVFSVRRGPQYRKFRMKAPAPPETLYDMVAVDLYTCEQKIEHMSRFMKLGDLERESTHPLPSIFIVNFMLPLSEPRMFSNDPNGPTLAFHFIMKLSSWAKENPDHPSVQLAARFINDSGPNGSMRERLKIIVQVSNVEEMELGKVERGLCRQYNGLPFLYRTYNSQYHRGVGWFQADFDGHRSGYAARLGRHSLLGWSEKIVANCGFLVEGETDDELPERMLGCANVHRLYCRSAPHFIKPMATPLMPRPSVSQSKRGHALSLLSENDDDDDVSEDFRRRRGHEDSLLSEPEENFADALSDERKDA